MTKALIHVAGALRRIGRWLLEGGPDGPVIGGNRWESSEERAWWKSIR